MVYELPEYFIESLNYGEVNMALSKALAKTKLKDKAIFKDINYETLVSYVKGYIAFKFLCNKSDIERYTFYKLICSEYVIAGLIEEFNDIIINTGRTNKEIFDSDTLAKLKYFQLLFKENSESYKKLDENTNFIFNEVKKIIINDNLDITPEELTKLVKCEIASEKDKYESSSGKDVDIFKYMYVSDIVPLVYQIRKDALESCEDKFAIVEKDKMVLLTVHQIVSGNNIDGRCL